MLQDPEEFCPIDVPLHNATGVCWSGVMAELGMGLELPNEPGGIPENSPSPSPLLPPLPCLLSSLCMALVSSPSAPVAPTPSLSALLRMFAGLSPDAPGGETGEGGSELAKDTGLVAVKVETRIQGANGRVSFSKHPSVDSLGPWH